MHFFEPTAFISYFFKITMSKNNLNTHTHKLLALSLQTNLDKNKLLNIFEALVTIH